MVNLFVAFLFGFSAGIFFAIWPLGWLGDQPAVKETPVLDKFKFWKPEPEPPKDYPVQSLPRGRGSWRRQKQALEASHNSKQKERDALTRGL